MKQKIVILSYYSKPGNFAASARIDAWMNYLPQHGIYPILITRQWPENATDFTAISDQPQRIHTKTEKSEIIKIPFSGKLRDRFVARYGQRFLWLSKIMSFTQLFLQNLLFRSSLMPELYREAFRYIKENPDADLIVASGKPYILFQYCDKIKKNYPQIKWVADYRDPWNTDANLEDSLKWRLYKRYESPFEKLWTRSASHIITVSQGVADGLSSFLERDDVEVIRNGYRELDFPFLKTEKDMLSIGYIGTLYDQQKIEIFLEALDQYTETNPASKIQMHFFGLSDQPVQLARVQKSSQPRPNLKIQYHHKMPQAELYVAASKCHLFLICGMPKRRGTLTAKVFDYFALQRPILLCPSDEEVLEKTIEDTGTGYVANTVLQTTKILELVYNQFADQGYPNYTPDKDELEKYHVSSQVKKLAHLLTNLDSHVRNIR